MGVLSKVAVVGVQCKLAIFLTKGSTHTDQNMHAPKHLAPSAHSLCKHISGVAIVAPTVRQASPVPVAPVTWTTLAEAYTQRHQSKWLCGRPCVLLWKHM